MLTQERLKELLHYDPETGIFTWTKARKKIKIGDIAGGFDTKGYILIGIFGKKYRANRLAWLYIYGYSPEKYIDHINGIQHDNRLCNLREATQAENMKNCKKHIDNMSGYKGVSWSKYHNKWHARSMVNGKKHHLGYFTNLQDAAATYQFFAALNHGEFYRGA